MNKSQITAEYDITGSRDIGFDTHPSAALQCLAGAFLARDSPVSVSNGSSQKAAPPAESPRGVADRLGQRFQAFRTALEGWKKLSKKLLTAKLPKDLRGLARSVQSARDSLEKESLQMAVALRETHDILTVCAAGLNGCQPEDFRVHLGLPSPVVDEHLGKAPKLWQDALLQAKAFELPQDPEISAIAARVEFIADEMVESLKEITREAKWLMTNEPCEERVISLMQWLFDLRCECLEIAPALACLKTPVNIWLLSTQAPGNAADTNAGKAQMRQPGG
ncbi:MAG: hypothetical protein IT209_08660 [Armatimonadetes bacterium]|nr:hypothetical protein [Armatimonadota bacterium]